MNATKPFRRFGLLVKPLLKSCLFGLVCLMMTPMSEKQQWVFAQTQQGATGGLLVLSEQIKGGTGISRTGNPDIPERGPEPKPLSFPALPLAQNLGVMAPCAKFDKTRTTKTLEEECLPVLEEEMKKSTVLKIPDPEAFGFMGKHVPPRLFVAKEQGNMISLSKNNLAETTARPAATHPKQEQKINPTVKKEVTKIKILRDRAFPSFEGLAADGMGVEIQETVLRNSQRIQATILKRPDPTKEGMMDTTTTLALWALLAFLVERVTNGMALIFSYGKWWRAHMEYSPSLGWDARAQIDRNRRVTLFGLSAGIAMMCAVMWQLDLFAYLGLALHPQFMAYILTGILIAAGAEPIREAFRLREQPKESTAPQPIHIQGTLTLQQPGSIDEEGQIKATVQSTVLDLKQEPKAEDRLPMKLSG